MSENSAKVKCLDRTKLSLDFETKCGDGVSPCEKSLASNSESLFTNTNSETEITEIKNTEANQINHLGKIGKELSCDDIIFEMSQPARGPFQIKKSNSMFETKLLKRFSISQISEKSPKTGSSSNNKKKFNWSLNVKRKEKSMPCGFSAAPEKTQIVNCDKRPLSPILCLRTIWGL